MNSNENTTAAPQRGSPSKSVRLQVELPRKTVEGIDSLANVLGLSTRKAYVENAIVLLAWAIKESQEGREIASVAPSGDDYFKVLLPCLEGLKNHEAPKEYSKTGEIEVEGAEVSATV